MNKDLLLAIALFILGGVFMIGGIFSLVKGAPGPRGSVPTLAQRKKRLRYRLLAGVLTVAMAVCAVFSGRYFAKYNTDQADAMLLAVPETVPESETATEASGGIIDFDSADMIPVIDFDMDAWVARFGQEIWPYKGTSLSTMAQYRLKLTSLETKNGQGISDALDIPLWMPIDEVVYSKYATMSLVHEGENSALAEALEEAKELKAASEALKKEERMSEFRAELYARIISNPVDTEAYAQLLRDDTATINNWDGLDKIIESYARGRERTKSDTADGRGIGVAYWTEYQAGHNGDLDAMVTVGEQFENGAFICSLLDYYDDADIASVMSSEHWKNNCSAKATMTAPEHIVAPDQQEDMPSYQLKFYDKKGNLISWIGANIADARPMRFKIPAPTARKKVSNQQQPQKETETTAPPPETTVAVNPTLQIIYLWDDGGIGPGRGSVPAPAVRYSIPAGTSYHQGHPKVDGARITRVESPQKVAGGNYYQAISGKMPLGGATWYVYYKVITTGRNHGGGGGGGSTKPTDPTKPTEPSSEPDTKPTDPTKPTEPSSEPDTKPDPTKPSPDGQGGKDPAVNPAPEGNAPSGGGDANGGPGSDQDQSAANETTRDYPDGESERESREDATQASREEAGKGDTTGTSNKVKEDPTVKAPDDAVDSKGEVPLDRTSQEGTGSTGVETTTKDNGDGTSTTTESKVDTGNEEVSGTLGDPTDQHTTGDGSAAPDTGKSADITPDRPAAPDPEAASPNTGATDNNRGSTGGGSQSGSSSGGSNSTGSGSGSGANSGDGDGDGDSSGISSYSDSPKSEEKTRNSSNDSSKSEDKSSDGGSSKSEDKSSDSGSSSQGGGSSNDNDGDGEISTPL